MHQADPRTPLDHRFTLAWQSSRASGKNWKKVGIAGSSPYFVDQGALLGNPDKVWRIHFTAEDLARTTISPGFGPLAETLWGLSLLHCPAQRPVAFGGWRENAYRQLTGENRPELRPLTMLMPKPGYMVDLVTLTGEQVTIEESLDALLDVPRDRLLGELAASDQQYPLPLGAWQVAESGSEARQQLAQATQAAYQALVEPYWPRIGARLRAEQAARGRILMEGGVERLLTTLHPTTIRWAPPVLQVLMDEEIDIYLGGRGLVLVPALFVGEFPKLYYDIDENRGAPVLAFPAAGDLPDAMSVWTGGTQPGHTALAALLGRTRAAALAAIGDGCTTTELSRQVHVSPAAASQHTAVLRDAGLISTRRQGSAVLHTLTPLGVELLEGGPARREKDLQVTQRSA
jgi:DNA-binding transcriptional ArsR family regulator